jgi:NAD(P)-dependent dehydrogenase (short-subunit alcohol dehydrogenase family)
VPTTTGTTALAQHPALTPGRGAVISGAASGIGLAAAGRLARLGMRVCMVDIDAAALAAARAQVARHAAADSDIIAVRADVSRVEEVEQVRGRVHDAFGDLAFLMNNAGTEGGGELFGDPRRFRQILEVNLWGVVNGIQTFAPAMAEAGRPAAIVSTGSKQGITTPPGDTAYNVSKAGVKVVTEALAHELRNRPGCAVTAHLLIPGFTFTGFTRARGVTERPPGAWTADQVVEFLLAGMAAGDFYILCPDNDVTREVDARRIRWAAEDIVQNRPPLSRWHPDFKEAFARSLE